MFEILSSWDIIIIAAYFGFTLIVAWWASGKSSKSQKDLASVDYFLAGKSEGWFVIVFVPFYLRTGVYTMPEFLEKRYSKACRNYLSVVSVLAYVITKISLIIFSGALIFESMGVPFWTGAIITVLVTGFYTVLGGLKAVIYTDMVQAFILIGGCAAVTYFAISELGGWDEMISTIQIAATKPNHPPVERFFNLWRPMSDIQYPWTGIYKAFRHTFRDIPVCFLFWSDDNRESSWRASA